VKGYFETAKRDREAFELLYKNKMYSLATFHVQQYIEKLAKVFSIEFDLISPSDVQSHNFLEWFERDAIKKGRTREEAMKSFSRLREFDAVQRCSQEDITFQILNFQKQVKESIPRIIPGLSKEQLETTSRYYATMTTILLYSMPHEQSSRYPAIYLDDLDYNFYCEGSQIVQSLPLLFGHAMDIENLLIEKTKYLSDEEKRKMKVDVDLSRLVNEKDFSKLLPYQKKMLKENCCE